MTDPTVERLTSSLIRALRKLGDAGEPEMANQLAGEAYAGIRRDEPRATSDSTASCITWPGSSLPG
jgi:DNA-binding MurR/RpiR family transcriptional regulator